MVNVCKCGDYGISNFVHVSAIYLISSVGNVKAVSSDLKQDKIIEWFVVCNREECRLKRFSMDVALFNNSIRDRE